MKKQNSYSLQERRGGGQVKKLLPKNSKNIKKSLTRPLIASSLALTLCASYAVAQDVSGDTINEINSTGEYNFKNDGSVTNNITLNGKELQLTIKDLTTPSQ